MLTVRDTSDSDTNTSTTLRGVVTKYPGVKVSAELNFSPLSAAHGFARWRGRRVGSSWPSSIVSTVCYCNLAGPFQMIEDGYENTIQITYPSHVALVFSLGASGLKVVASCCSKVTGTRRARTAMLIHYRWKSCSCFPSQAQKNFEEPCRNVTNTSVGNEHKGSSVFVNHLSKSAFCFGVSPSLNVADSGGSHRGARGSGNLGYQGRFQACSGAKLPAASRIGRCILLHC